jgi:hypothetical protein
MLRSLDTMVGRVIKAIQVLREMVLKYIVLYNCTMYMHSVLVMQHWLYMMASKNFQQKIAVYSYSFRTETVAKIFTFFANSRACVGPKSNVVYLADLLLLTSNLA